MWSVRSSKFYSDGPRLLFWVCNLLKLIPQLTQTYSATSTLTVCLIWLVTMTNIFRDFTPRKKKPHLTFIKHNLVFGQRGNFCQAKLCKWFSPHFADLKKWKCNPRGPFQSILRIAERVQARCVAIEDKVKDKWITLASQRHVRNTHQNRQLLARFVD